MSFQDDLDFDPSDDDGLERPEVIEGFGIHVIMHCGRIDCDEQHAMAVNEDGVHPLKWFGPIAANGEHSDKPSFLFILPPGWGYDRHDGINAALHCPKHRQAPTEAEVAEINARLSAEQRHG